MADRIDVELELFGRTFTLRVDASQEPLMKQARQAIVNGVAERKERFRHRDELDAILLYLLKVQGELLERQQHTNTEDGKLMAMVDELLQAVQPNTKP